MNTSTTGRSRRQKRSWLSRLRRGANLLNTFDPDTLNRLLESVKESQQRIAASQQEIQTTQREIQTRITALDHALVVSNQIQNVSVLNIKNLGYEIGRSLAKKDLSKPVLGPVPTKLKSKLCVQSDFDKDWLLFWANELRTAPYYHRKIWELCYICQVLFASGKLVPGQHGLGFGCGQEPLPSLFAKYGATVVATDLEDDRPEAAVWQLTQQHGTDAERYRRRDICPDEERLASIEFRPLDMNAISRDLDGQFDFCWSACAFEHLGSLAKGLEFVENSLTTLKKGGIAVHTTEFTLNDGETIDNHPIVLYQSHHLLQFAEKIRLKGYEVVPFDFNPGDQILDRYIDLPPWSDKLYLPSQSYAHLKLSFSGFTCTSVGFIIKA